MLYFEKLKIHRKRLGILLKGVKTHVNFSNVRRIKLETVSKSEESKKRSIPKDSIGPDFNMILNVELKSTYPISKMVQFVREFKFLVVKKK